MPSVPPFNVHPIDARKLKSEALCKVHRVSLRADLPGFTRSVYERDHALVTPESRVFQGASGWCALQSRHAPRLKSSLATFRY